MAQPFETGYRAGLRGADPRSCPFASASGERREWQRWHGYGVSVAGHGIDTEAMILARENRLFIRIAAKAVPWDTVA